MTFHQSVCLWLTSSREIEREREKNKLDKKKGALYTHFPVINPIIIYLDTGINIAQAILYIIMAEHVNIYTAHFPPLITSWNK